MFQDLRRPVVAGDQDIGEGLVVAKLYVEARPQLLDQVGLEQQRFGLGRGRDDLDIGGRRNHAQDARRQGGVDARVGREPFADVLGLADIEHVVGSVQHAVDAGRGRRELDRVFDRAVSDRERALGDRLGGVFGKLRQPSLFVLLGRRRRRVDVGGCRGPAAANRPQSRAAPYAKAAPEGRSCRWSWPKFSGWRRRFEVPMRSGRPSRTGLF